MEEVKIHSGSRIRLKRVADNVIPAAFLERLLEYAQTDDRVEAIYVFALQPEEQDEQPCLTVAVKSGFFSKGDESFLQVVSEIQNMLPEDLAINLYRFGASDFLASYCVKNLEPLFLRHPGWLDKQRKKHVKD